MMPNDHIKRGLGLSEIGFDAVNEQTGLQICQCICQLTVHDILERHVSCRLQIKEVHAVFLIDQLISIYHLQYD